MIEEEYECVLRFKFKWNSTELKSNGIYSKLFEDCNGFNSSDTVVVLQARFYKNNFPCFKKRKFNLFRDLHRLFLTHSYIYKHQYMYVQLSLYIAIHTYIIKETILKYLKDFLCIYNV